jgi:hypothetical protein
MDSGWLIAGVILEALLAIFLFIFGFILNNFKTAIRELQIAIKSLETFMNIQGEKNAHWTMQIDALWEKYNILSEQLHKLKDRVLTVENQHRNNHGKDYR